MAEVMAVKDSNALRYSPCSPLGFMFFIKSFLGFTE